MLVLGLTGGIAMGKSTASAIFRSFDVPVFDADAEVHRLLDRDRATAAAVAAAFPGCLDAAGRIDRAALGRMVFGDPARLDRLEAILHPRVRAAQRTFLARCAAAGRPLAVLDIPLLFEAGSDRLVDAVVVVSAPPLLQAQRALRRPGMSAARLAVIRARQMPERERRRRADFVVPSGFGRRATVEAIGAVLGRVRGRAARVWPHGWRRVSEPPRMR